MDPRQKGDLYWKKRKLYFDSVERRGDLNEGYLNEDTAHDVLRHFSEIKEEACLSDLTGDEFMECPPTEAGHEFFAFSVALLMKVRDSLQEALIKDVIRRVLDDFFATCGVTEQGEPVDDPEKKKAARERLKKSIDDYEKLIQNGRESESERALLYRQEASYYYERCIACNKPIDTILYETVPTIIRWDVQRLDGRKLLKDIEGFTEQEETFERRQKKKDILSLEQLLKYAERVKDYISEHPFIFDAQCLLSVTTETKGLFEIVRLAEDVSRGFDMLTGHSDFIFPQKNLGEMILEPWLLTETAARVGRKVLDFVREYKEYDIGTATDALREMLPKISFSMKQKVLEKALKTVLFERSGQNAF